jgi:TPR repeat protein
MSQVRLGFIHYDRARLSFNQTKVAALVAGKTWEQANREAAKNPETAQDFAEAAKWFRKAAEQAYVSAEEVLGELYLNGQGVSEDHHEAVKWLRKAANHGDSMDKCFLASATKKERA